MNWIAAALCMGLAGVLSMAQAETGKAEAEPLRLWEGDAPGARGTADVDVPTITPWLLDGGSSPTAAIIVCPGGGYHSLSPFEGDDYARWMNGMGISAFVLKYRLGSAGYRHPVMLQDASRAVRMVRARADEWGVDPERVGMIGSSAGGHLVSMVMTNYDAGDASSTDTVERQSSRPDLGILCYPAINYTDIAHVKSREFLLGENPSQEAMEELSTEMQVDEKTPPAFLFHTTDDTVVDVEHSLRFASALAKHDVPFALHVYPHGVHGIGLGTREWNPEARHPWTTQCEIWLRERGFAR